MAPKDIKQERVTSTSVGSMLSSPFACITVQMALKAAIELNVFDILAHSGPHGTQLSAPQIAFKIHTPTLSPRQVGVTALYRILRFLSSNSFLTTSLTSTEDHQEHADIIDRRLFGLTPLTANTMARVRGADDDDDDDLPSSAAFVLFISQIEIVQSYNMLKCSVLNPNESTPFEIAHGGVGFYDYVAHKPDSKLSSMFSQSMSCSNKSIFDNVTRLYDGFVEVVQLTDVGGNHGSTLEHLISVYPNIHDSINFDLPHVIARAPPVKGVEHVAGDMFEALPNSKTILLKWILHNWSDDKCVKLLQNCWKALPEDQDGKVIVVELVIPDELEGSQDEVGMTSMDICMLALCRGGRERTLVEFKYLATEGGFSDVKVVPLENGFHVLEFLKRST